MHSKHLVQTCRHHHGQLLTRERRTETLARKPCAADKLSHHARVALILVLATAASLRHLLSDLRKPLLDQHSCTMQAGATVVWPAMPIAAPTQAITLQTPSTQLTETLAHKPKKRLDFEGYLVFSTVPDLGGFQASEAPVCISG